MNIIHCPKSSAKKIADLGSSQGKMIDNYQNKGIRSVE